MTTKTLPQRHCRGLAEHDAHTWRFAHNDPTSAHRCPGRFTPRLRGVGIVGDPAQPDDPFAGIEE